MSPNFEYVFQDCRENVHHFIKLFTQNESQTVVDVFMYSVFGTNKLLRDVQCHFKIDMPSIKFQVPCMNIVGTLYDRKDVFFLTSQNYLFEI